MHFIPEILLLIGNYLDRNDLASCMLVSKHWSSVFSQLVWGDIVFKGDTFWRTYKQPSVADLVKHSGYVRSLDVHKGHVIELLDHCVFEHLESLHLGQSLSTDHTIPAFIVRHGSTLKRLKLFYLGRILCPSAF